MFPPAALSSLPLPICYRSPPAIPSLGNCFPCGSIDLGKYVLYSSALRQRARWHTSLALSFGGHGTLPSDNSSVNDDARREPKTRTQRFVYARRDTEDGPLEIIPPEESTWFKFYVRNFYITQDTKLAKAFRNRFRLPYAQYLQLVEDICSNDLFDRWCGYKSNNKRWRRWSCYFLVRCVTSVMGGPSTTVKSRLPLIRMFTGLFSVHSYSLAVQFFTENGC